MPGLSFVIRTAVLGLSISIYSASPAALAGERQSTTQATKSNQPDKPTTKENTGGRLSTKPKPPSKEDSKDVRDSKASSAPPTEGKESLANSIAAKPAPIPDEIARLGPLSVGHPHAGYLVNAVRLPQGEDWIITMPSHAYGTQETIDALSLCIPKVRREHPGSHKVMLGSISAERGGHLPPHKSHRTGRDVDVYFFRHEGAKWNHAATQEDIDLKRTWALIECFATQTDVDMILIDKKVQGWLEAYALFAGNDPQWVRELFHDLDPYKRALIRHVPGHVAHMHVRLTSPVARRAALKHYDLLVDKGVVIPPKRAVTHEVAKGDTLSALALRYKLSVKQIQELNQLESSLIRIGQKLVLQLPEDIRGAREAVVVPVRRRPKLDEAAEEAEAAAPEPHKEHDDAAPTSARNRSAVPAG